ncbi:MAG: type II toxin-antitoxin system VapC family toxin [Dermatophilaceae bacterium]
MIVDTSALVAIVTEEPERDAMLDAIRSAVRVRMSAGTYLEVGVVVDGRRSPVLTRRLDDVITALGIEIVPLTPGHAALGRAAYRDFGKGGGHPARLNLGDCFAYALARETGEPLLFKGDDFIHTDVLPALPAG